MYKCFMMSKYTVAWIMRPHRRSSDMSTGAEDSWRDRTSSLRSGCKTTAASVLKIDVWYGWTTSYGRYSKRRLGRFITGTTSVWLFLVEMENPLRPQEVSSKELKIEHVITGCLIRQLLKSLRRKVRRKWNQTRHMDHLLQFLNQSHTMNSIPSPTKQTMWRSRSMTGTRMRQPLQNGQQQSLSKLKQTHSESQKNVGNNYLFSTTMHVRCVEVVAVKVFEFSPFLLTMLTRSYYAIYGSMWAVMSLVSGSLL